MRVSVVGLGPGRLDWITPAARSKLHAPGARVFVRTSLLPGLTQFLEGVAWESFDTVYDTARSLDEVHAAILTRLLSAGDDVVLAVPGDGVLGEAILSGLLASGATVEIVPGVPLGAGALAMAGLAAADGAQVVEATSLVWSGGLELLIELNPRWPAVVTGVYSPGVAGDLKLALLRVYPSDHAVRVVHHPGLDDMRVERVALAELDRGALAFDHLTHVVVPAVVGYTPTGSAHQMRAIVSRLRAPEIGCPWDLEQTHRSLIPYAIEEAYEVVDAIESDDVAGLADELGDVLLQVALHAEIADQSDEFEWNDIVRALTEKLVRRHPHVFGDVEVSNASDVVRNWDQLKAAERQHLPTPASALDGVPTSLPQLKRAAELARKASKAGFDWPTRDGTLAKVREELDELLASVTLAETREELGDLLYVLAKLASQDGLDPEEALRAANRKFTRRFAALEQIARERGWESLRGRPLEDLESAWSEAKRRVAAPTGP
jgi:tetrapyrrole methylase family protein/MazG family protein